MSAVRVQKFTFQKIALEKKSAKPGDSLRKKTLSIRISVRRSGVCQLARVSTVSHFVCEVSAQEGLLRLVTGFPTNQNRSRRKGFCLAELSDSRESCIIMIYFISELYKHDVFKDDQIFRRPCRNTLLLMSKNETQKKHREGRGAITLLRVFLLLHVYKKFCINNQKK